MPLPGDRGGSFGVSGTGPYQVRSIKLDLNYLRRRPYPSETPPEGTWIYDERPVYGPAYQEATSRGVIQYEPVALLHGRQFRKCPECIVCHAQGEGHRLICADDSRIRDNAEDEENFHKWSIFYDDPPHADLHWDIVLEDTEPEPEDSISCLRVHQKAYMMAQVQNPGKGIQKGMRVMEDNGNLTHTGVAMSEKFMQTLQLGYSSVGKGTVPTARKGQGMTNLGISEEFTLRLHGLKKAYNMKAIVCRELSDINVGTSFLQKISEKKMGDGPGNTPTLTFYQDGVTITTTEK